MSKVFDKVKKLTKKFSPQELKDLKERNFDQIDKNIEELKSIIDNSLPIEEESILEIKSLLNEKTEFRSKLNKNKNLNNLLEIAKNYSLLSLEPFKWRDENGMPNLVVFALDSPWFWFQGVCIEKRFELVRPRNIPEKIKNLYKDVCLSLIDDEKFKNANFSAVLDKYTVFDGVIPTATKVKIKEAEKYFENIFVVVEPKKWGVKIHSKEKSKSETDLDPIVVGWDGDNLWVIDWFDITPIEKLALWSSGIATE